ncbi:hypothetical protein BMS3Bbin04_00070 [bacterium BMS3Bbin04]|nr:hypothetical protein BMS3Bbin04_00070 [bacterium BMS3Bbin04]
MGMAVSNIHQLADKGALKVSKYLPKYFIPYVPHHFEEGLAVPSNIPITVPVKREPPPTIDGDVPVVSEMVLQVAFDEGNQAITQKIQTTVNTLSIRDSHTQPHIVKCCNPSESIFIVTI